MTEAAAPTSRLNRPLHQPASRLRLSLRRGFDSARSQCGLTFPSSGPTPAGSASLRGPLKSNYKGFPTCQENLALTNYKAMRQRNLELDHRVDPRIDAWRKGCGLDKLQPVIEAAAAGLRTLMEDARGGLIRWSKTAIRLLDLIRHSPRRSNLCSSTPGRHAVVDSISLAMCAARTTRPR